MERINKKSKPKNVKVIDPDEDFSKRKSVHSINSIWFLFGLVFLTVTINISSFILHYVPELKDTAIPFVGSEAWEDLKVLDSYGPKVCGTKQNEEMTVNYLKMRIKNIESKANVEQKVTMDHQICSGSFFLGFKPHGMIIFYRKIQNIVVKLDGETSNALMINCHFDSVPGSPGAGDDGANCAIMIELLSILSARKERNRHTIIFVFNGSEEKTLSASHGFITQHKWAKDIKAFINLEAAGSGGKESLFQTGPGHTWLLNHYKRVNRPFAQAAGEEIFQSGLIPSDTDFRIYRDFGNLTGMDFAHTAKGYRYHTKFDSIKFLSQSFVQRTGENMLELVLSLSSAHELDDISKFSKDSAAVYFDFLGFFFVSYSKEIGILINLVVVILAITIPFLTLTKATVNVHSKNILAETIIEFMSVVLSTGFSGLLCYLTAYFLDQMDYSMSWYKSTFLATTIYGSIAMLAHFIVHDLIDLTLANKKSPISLGLKVQARLNGVNVFWGIVTLGLTAIGLRVGYLFMIILLINLASNIMIYFCGLHNSVHHWVFVHLFGQFFIVLWTSYFHNTVLEVFIPIMGRSGSGRNPDALISIICCATLLFICSYLIPLTKLLKASVFKYLTMISIFSISIFFAISTNYGFPYQNDTGGNPAVQRHFIAHTARTFFDENGGVRHSDAGYYFVEWDRHAKKTIEGITIPDISFHFSEVCKGEVFCGMPLLSSRSLMLGGQWLPGSTPKFPDIAIVDKFTKTSPSENVVEYSFVVNGTSLSSLFIRPRQNANMVAWSLLKEIPESFNNTYFVSFATGIETEPFEFNITLQVNGDVNIPHLDLSLVSMRFDQKQHYTKDFKKILNRVPDWSFAVDCVAAVTSYVY